MDVRQQPRLWRVLFGGNLTRILKINFRFREIAKIFNFLPGNYFSLKSIVYIVTELFKITPDTRTKYPSVG